MYTVDILILAGTYFGGNQKSKIYVIFYKLNNGFNRLDKHTLLNNLQSRVRFDNLMTLRIPFPRSINHTLLELNIHL